MAKGVLIVENTATKELLTMCMENVTVSAADYAGIVAGGTGYTGAITLTFSKSDDRYNAVKATPAYTPA